ncbi:MAG: CocE/NonD family hydrolase [Clostridia bacterium]|nr:CocE/NonD family hydrolase [Clostridia bacterium]
MHAYSTFVRVGEAELYTLVALPDTTGRFPVVVGRSPYVDCDENKSDAELCEHILSADRPWLEAGYAVIRQHCRGRGRSSGDCIPYIYEREDTLALLDWIRVQSFYNGEIYLCGASYTSSVFLVAAPYAPDIKAAVLEVQDSERYNVCYRNGFLKCGLHGSWYVGMYKYKSIREKNYSATSFQMLPLSDFTKTVLGEPAADFDECIRHPRRDDPFWQTHVGGVESHNALVGAKIPILLITGFYDIYTGGIFDMWNLLDEETRAMCALIVHPYDHGCHPEKQPICFENGQIREAFGSYPLKWIESVRGKGQPPVELGKVTYYRLFENGWRTEDFTDAPDRQTIPLGSGEVTYTYNPYAPASFKGGLSCNFDGCAWQDAPNWRYDIKSFFSEPFAADTFVRGKMRARLTVKSDCEDTCFYVRVSLDKAEGAYGLRDDITQISNVAPDYTPGDTVTLDFTFDEHAFLIKAGERLRIDVSSSAFPHYLRHTNNRGLYSEQTTAKIAHNTIVLDGSELTIPVE